jgi:hypothetical protein
MNKFLIIIIFSWIKSFSYSQSESVKIDFKPVYGAQEIHFNEKIQVDSLNWIAFSKIKFYVGNFRAITQGHADSSQLNKYYLINFSDSSKSSITIELKAFSDSICFLIGTDRTVNVGGLFDGALDPINGMYWAWNSGYINTKIEGSSSITSSPDKKFEYHIGGYASPYITAQEYCFNPKVNEVFFKVDLSKVINSKLLEFAPSIIIPGEKAKIFADNFKSTFIQIER